MKCTSPRLVVDSSQDGQTGSLKEQEIFVTSTESDTY